MLRFRQHLKRSVNTALSSAAQHTTNEARPKAARMFVGALPLLATIVWPTSSVHAQQSITAQAGDRPAGWMQQSRSAVMSRYGMVATSVPLASEAGLRILLQGGNAIDAAVATAATLNVVEPMNFGIGGDMFAIVYLAQTHELLGLNASGWAPTGATVAAYDAKGFTSMPQTGIFSVTVPGAVDGWDQLLKRAGTMTFQDVLRPAIEYADGGYPVTEITRNAWAESVSKLSRDPDSASTWLVDGQAPALGSVFRNPNLAASLQLLAQRGRDAFYLGPLAQAMVAKSQSLGGFFTMDDFANYHAEWVEPIQTTYRGYEVFELPPNGQGMAVLEMLNILEGYDLKSLGPNNPLFWHYLIEAKKLAFADLSACLADPRFHRVPVNQIISKSYADSQRARISPNQAAASVPVSPLCGTASGPEVSTGDTVYLTTADRWGNMVSFIGSLYGAFGSGVTAGDSGIVLQNRGGLFVLDPNHPNHVAPHKRPYHTIIPAYVMKDGKPWMSFGVMGGDQQPQGHTQVLVNMIDLGMNVQAAGDAARFHHDQTRNTVAVESGIPSSVVSALQAKGHTVVQGGSFGGYQAIQFYPVPAAPEASEPLRQDRRRDDEPPGVYQAGSEFRKDGLAIGY